MASPTTQEQRDRYLELVAEGMSPSKAGKAVGSTGSRFRALRNPDAVNYDSVFAYRFEQASAAGAQIYKDDLRAEIRDRAFDREDKASAGLLRMEAEAMLEEYEHRRVRHTRLGQDGPFQIQAVMPTVTQEALDSMSTEDMEMLVTKMKELIAMSESPKLRAIEGGQ